MRCPFKQFSFHTTEDCEDDCALYIDGKCAFVVIAEGNKQAKGNQIGIRIDDGYNAKIDGSIIRDTKDTREHSCRCAE